MHIVFTQHDHNGLLRSLEDVVANEMLLCRSDSCNQVRQGDQARVEVKLQRAPRDVLGQSRGGYPIADGTGGR